ncbi:MAG: hypothetical protein FJW31_07045 [Acidobacteria bacterium]|nr:hypothetical protein [Acidobacteriota bacterium]
MTWAADISGKWKASVPTPNGNTHEVQMNFKQDGEKLTGTVGNHEGDTEIVDGKVVGDQVSFAINRPNGQIALAGTAAGDEMKLSLAMGDRKIEFTAKREAAK